MDKKATAAEKMRYKSIQQLMADGEFRKALAHLSRILQKKPDDEDARKLEFLCREIIHIQESCREKTSGQKEISVEEYITVHYRRLMKKVCSFVLLLLNKLPEKWQKKLWMDRFKIWKFHFTAENDSQKDMMFELLFWDNDRRKIVFSVLSGILLLGIVIFLLLAFRGEESSEVQVQIGITEISRSAYDGDVGAQYLLGKKFYLGQHVKRDIEQAQVWLTKAARAGHKEAGVLLQKILIERENPGNIEQNNWEQNDKDERL